MIAYSHEGGYGNVNVAEAQAAIDLLPPGSLAKITLLELLYDYECLRRVIEGNGYLFRHEDRSEVRRLKLYEGEPASNRAAP